MYIMYCFSWRDFLTCLPSEASCSRGVNNVKMILEGKLICPWHRITPQKPVLGRIWSMAREEGVPHCRLTRGFIKWWLSMKTTCWLSFQISLIFLPRRIEWGEGAELLKIQDSCRDSVQEYCTQGCLLLTGPGKVLRPVNQLSYFSSASFYFI
jgi:hypothetical protein